jgi:S1-C subfamily serine protease
MRGLSRSQRGRIQLGDVIVEIDGREITNESDYADVMEEHRPGDIVEVITLRDNQRLRYEIELQTPQNN